MNKGKLQQSSTVLWGDLSPGKLPKRMQCGTFSPRDT
jgi:hypothetical protein